MNSDADATQQGLTRDEFATLFRRLKSTADWDTADRRGALNHITSAHLIAAAMEVRLGRSVSLARPIETEPAADDPEGREGRERQALLPPSLAPIKDSSRPSKDGPSNEDAASRRSGAVRRSNDRCATGLVRTSAERALCVGPMPVKPGRLLLVVARRVLEEVGDEHDEHAGPREVTGVDLDHEQRRGRHSARPHPG